MRRNLPIVRTAPDPSACVYSQRRSFVPVHALDLRVT